MEEFDAVVIGSGPNGLAAAISAARAGWSVLVLEANVEPGGCVRSAELTLDGVTHDLFSAFYPMGVSSPIFDRFRLGDFGLRWCRADIATAHPAPDGQCAIVGPDTESTAGELDLLTAGEGDAWRNLMAVYDHIQEALWDNLYSALPPVIPGMRLLAELQKARIDGYGPLDFAQLTLSSVRGFGENYFHGEPLRRMLCAFALHSDLSPEAATSSVYACVLAWTAQAYGFPVPEGGAGSLTKALVACLASHGGQVRCDRRVTEVQMRGNRAYAVATENGEQVLARHAIFADVSPPSLFRDLVGLDHLPNKIVRRLERFRWGSGVFKMDWALQGPVPWKDEVAQRAATVHLGDSVDDMSRYANEVTRNLLPAHPYLLLGQPCVADSTRAPEGITTLWGYTHVPSAPSGDAQGHLVGGWAGAAQGFADRIEDRIEALAPGFRDKVLARHIMTPLDLEAANANLVGGDIAGGTFDISQQLIFRPLPGMFRYRTPIRGLYLCSASTHPSGGVHGGPGALAFAAARRDRTLRLI